MYCTPKKNRLARRLVVRTTLKHSRSKTKLVVKESNFTREKWKFKNIKSNNNWNCRAAQPLRALAAFWEPV